MRATHSRNNSRRPVLAAELTVCTQNSALHTTRDVLQSGGGCPGCGVEEGEAWRSLMKIKKQRVGGRGEKSDSAQQEDERLQMPPGVCCKQEMIYLLSAPNGPFPKCVKGASGKSSEVKRSSPPPKQCCCGERYSHLGDCSRGAFFVFPRLDAAGIKWKGGRGGGSPIVPLLVHCSPPLPQTKVFMSTARKEKASKAS